MNCRFVAKPLHEHMSIEQLGTNFSEIRIKVQIFDLIKLHLKMLTKRRPFCLGRIMLNQFKWNLYYSLKMLKLYLCTLDITRFHGLHFIINLVFERYTWCQVECDVRLSYVTHNMMPSVCWVRRAPDVVCLNMGNGVWPCILYSSQMGNLLCDRTWTGFAQKSNIWLVDTLSLPLHRQTVKKCGKINL